MVVQVIGVGFKNKGAELMLYAVMQHLKSHFPEVIVTVDLRCGSFRQRSRVGLYHLAWLHSRKFPYMASIIDILTRLIPKKIRDVLKVVCFYEVDMVLDASGFVYSDHQDSIHSLRMKNYSRNIKQAGKRLIMLPQAFGPFEKKQIREAMFTILGNADLVFARDTISLQHLLNLHSNSENIKKSPDFTCLVSGTCPVYFNPEIRRPCVVPNYRMIDRTTSDVGEKYISFLMICINHLIQHDLDPFILVHEDNDLVFSKEIQQKLCGKVEIIHESNPISIKGILGVCSVVISSRYHGLISALSQGVPSLATGWSHKYEMLMAEYNCLECLIDMSAPEYEIRCKIDMARTGETRKDLISRIERAALEQKNMAQKMWDMVDALTTDEKKKHIYIP